MQYLFRMQNIKLPITHGEAAIAREIQKRMRTKHRPDTFSIVRQSLDARKKDALTYCYTVDFSYSMPIAIPQKEKNHTVRLEHAAVYKFTPSGTEPIRHRPVIVGSGPCGLFCGYLLTLWGYRPLIIERGEAMDDRTKRVEAFWEGNAPLHPDSNVQFGEGGAGTFSDGKLNTLIKDPSCRIRFVMETFIQFGAQADILYAQKPHIGTDRLRVVVKSMREAMKAMGAEFRFSTCLTNLSVRDGSLYSITVKNVMTGVTEVIPCSVMVLAPGHSARDTFCMLYDKGMTMEQKPFAVGVRVEHPQSMISEQQYGKEGAKLLPAASYKVTAKTASGRGVYSFCMCPGGYVVNASSEPGRLAVNGMSYSGRDGQNANSAIIVTVTPDDFASDHPLAGMTYQRELEERAFRAGNGQIPVSTFGDFKSGKVSTEFGAVSPQTKGSWCFADLNTILPKPVADAIIQGMESFGSMICGFDREDAVLSAVESRTSSPVRLVRDDGFESNIRGVYPAGEGAGYAGGITSAAVDGIRVAEAIAARYKI